MRFLLILSLVCVLSCGGPHTASPASLPDLFVEQTVSPDTGSHQGYATDGDSHFLFDTRRILKRADDAIWQITAVNDTPFIGLPLYNHLGDGDYFEGYLYVAAERYVSCSDHSSAAVIVFNAETLARNRVITLSEGQEISGVAVDPDERKLWVSSYCDGSQLWVYDLDTMQLVRTVTLSPPVPNIQGFAYRKGVFFLAQNTGTLRKLSLDGSSVQVYHTNSPGAHEGLDYSQAEIRWLIDEGLGQQKVHFLVPK